MNQNPNCAISADPDGVTTVRTATTVRRTSLTEVGPRTFAHASIDLHKPGQTFASLYCTVAAIIKDCGPCSRSDLAMVPALSRYSLFQIERALFTAEHHGLILRVGSIPSHHPDADTSDDPDAVNPGIYDVDALGPIDRSNPQDTIMRALARRSPLEITWLVMTRLPLCMSQNHDSASNGHAPDAEISHPAITGLADCSTTE